MIRPRNQKKMDGIRNRVLKNNQNQIFTVLPMDKGLQQGSQIPHWVPELPVRDTKGSRWLMPCVEPGSDGEIQLYPSHCIQMRESLFPRRMWEERGEPGQHKCMKESSPNAVKWLKAWSLGSDIPLVQTTSMMVGKLFYCPDSPSIHT